MQQQLRAIHFLFLILLAGIANGSTDSLKTAFSSQLPDTSKIRTALLLAKNYMQSNVDSALLYGFEAYNLAKKNNDAPNQANAAKTIGVIYMNKAQYDKSLAYLLEAVKLYEKVGDKQGVSFSYNNIGSVNYHTGKYAEALMYYKMSLALKIELGLQKEVSSTYINIGNIFMKKEQYDSCIFYYKRGLENAEKNKDEYNISASLMNLGEAYIDIKNYNRALEYYNKALAVNTKRNDQYHLTNCYYAIGKILTATKNYPEAEKNLQKALAMAQKSGTKQLELNILKYFSSLYEKKGDHNQALLYYKRYHALNDTIYNAENLKRIDELKAKYETELKDKRIHELNMDKTIAEEKAQSEKTFRNSLIIASTLIAIICLVLFRNVRLKIKTNRLLLEKNRQIEEHQQEIEQINKELDEYNKALMTENITVRYEILKTKINPHFLFNSLSTLSTLIIKNQKQALDFVGRFSKLYRNILKSGENKLVTLEEEMEFAGHYLYLQRMRFGGNLVVEIDISPNQYSYYIPPFTIQLLIENAIKHNMISDENKLVISIKAHDEQIIIGNNLQRKHIQEPSTGIGQQNIIERYRMLGEDEPEFGEKNGYYEAKVPLLKLNVAV